MPRYYFDTHNGRSYVKDDEGQELASLQEARLCAQSALSDIAKDEMPKAAPPQTMTIAVRDETGTIVLRAALVLMVEIPA